MHLNLKFSRLAKDQEMSLRLPVCFIPLSHRALGLLCRFLNGGIKVVLEWYQSGISVKISPV